jgi:Lon protease-like protein
MALTDIYRTPADLPAEIPIFPLGGALLLPRGQLPLNIFEPRYLAMTNAAIAAERVIGMVQPNSDAALAAQDDASQKPEVYHIGCAGRITSFSETGDGRILITLTGITRFRIVAELDSPTPYRMCRIDCAGFADDLVANHGEEAVDRERLIDVFRRYLEAHNMEADWDSVHKSSNENLVNTLSMISSYAPKEKQALLEARDLAHRADILIALTEMALSDPSEGGGTPLQ